MHVKAIFTPPYRQPTSTPQSNYNYAHQMTELLLNKRLDGGNEDFIVYMEKSKSA